MSINRIRKQLGIDKIVPDKYYRHDQGLASDEWVCDHNLGKIPSVTVIDHGGNQVEGAEEHTSLYQTIIRFSAALSGEAHFN